MRERKQRKDLTVPPFECAWCEDLRFRDAGRGCVAFEAFAHNDVTLVFREQVGSQHYHYKMDNSPNYTVILGSHRNRRLKIEVDGKTVVDAANIGLCNSLAFQAYWISIYDGLISIGKGRHPFQDTVFQWLDSNPNCSVQYVGLSSWDKHVGYRNVSVLPLTQHKHCQKGHIDYKEYEEEYNEDWENEDGLEGFEEWGLANFLESWDLSDMFFDVGQEEKLVPAHRVIVGASGTFHFDSSDGNVISLPSITYPVLHAFLEYIYTGRTKIVESQLGMLHDLSAQFQVCPLMKQCREIIDRFRANKRLYDFGKKVEISFSGSQFPQNDLIHFELPINHQSLHHFLTVGEYSDVDVYIDNHVVVSHAHKIILSMWSAPFAKMFTNGMIESTSSEIFLKDISSEAFLAMLQFMYSGYLEINDPTEESSLLISLLLLADQFAVAPLHRECSKYLLECMSEDIVCFTLRAISSVQSCKLLEDSCKRIFSMHFDYCTSASTEFVLLEEQIFKDILEQPDLTVTSEERVLDAILMWCNQASEVCSWETTDDLLKCSTPELIFNDRQSALEFLLPSVRFPLMPSMSLEKLASSSLCSQVPEVKKLVMEAVHYQNFKTTSPDADHNLRFQHRKSGFKELQYICDGDSNGVIYFAGTSYGEHQWVNPALSKKITVTASSPPSRYTDAKALVSRIYQATSYAGPRIEHDRKCAWWMVDIGQDHQLMCNYYTLRQDGSNAFVRSWAFQGSCDGENWTDFRVHENDQTICKRGQFASWPILGATALLPFRYFRVYMTAPTSDVSNPWNLCICFIELYGYFH